MITPKDIDNQQFEVAFRGYNSREVDEFLARLSQELAELYAEEEALKKRIAAAELIAKDAKDREEEFIASMAHDREEATAILESARAEGEKIILAAKRAAAGIMTEVRRHAAEISAKAKRSAETVEAEATARAAALVSAAETEAKGILDTAEAGAADIRAAAKQDADALCTSARTEADNVTRAAEIRARALTSDAKAESDALIAQANNAATLCEDYMRRIREDAMRLCFELDAELRNGAARITVLGKRIAESPDPAPAPVTEVTPPQSTAPASEAVEAGAEDLPPAHMASAEEDGEEAYDDALRFFDTADDTVSDDGFDSDDVADDVAEAADTAAPAESSGRESYFTEEYRRVMEELFGGDAGLSSEASGDDDTYDYLDRLSAERGRDDEDLDVNIYHRSSASAGDGVVTAELGGLSGAGLSDGDDVLDFFSSASVEDVYKSPSDEDISDIMSGL